MSPQRIPDIKAVFSAAASLAASAMLIRSVANEFLPPGIHNFFFSGFHHLSHHFSSQFTIVIEEFQGQLVNQVFEAANVYLGTIVNPSTQRVRLSKAENEKRVEITIDRNEEMVDVFENVQVKWRLICTQVDAVNFRHRPDLNATLRSEIKSYELSFHKKHKEKVLGSYLPYILERSKAIKEESKAIKLRTVAPYDGWDSNAVNLSHPMTFKNLAMDSGLKKALVEDLENFLRGEGFYRRIGKAWKRGYLLYGPPGTGKSSLIAAIANHLNFDIYDLDLADVQSNWHLRSLLLSTSSRSIIVIEDIDCTIKLQNREDGEVQDNSQKVTLSGLLNFIDGLWSYCGDERVIIFTTNHKERLDPALLRAGRMDMHVEMSYCTFSAFKQLALNYQGLCHHQLFDQIEGLLKEVKVTPAEVAGELMKNTNAEISLHCLLKFLHKKMGECTKMITNENLEAEK
ncbi:AAA-ATPase At3g50940-like [Cornus florida]|uniref:AAA-ATPase At3g50940-like n=1 Tax=Cornus florida TaxID=4283 RepID=UPI00289EE583|nr:AAA-ATPase At3g50940-like [Cornus florida]